MGLVERTEFRQPQVGFWALHRNGLSLCGVRESVGGLQGSGSGKPQVCNLHTERTTPGPDQSSQGKVSVGRRQASLWACGVVAEVDEGLGHSLMPAFQAGLWAWGSWDQANVLQFRCSSGRA